MIEALFVPLFGFFSLSCFRAACRAVPLHFGGRAVPCRASSRFLGGRAVPCRASPRFLGGRAVPCRASPPFFSETSNPALGTPTIAVNWVVLVKIAKKG